MTKLPQAGAVVFPGVQLLQWFETPSSMWLLQLSSLPLQISPGGTFWAMMPTSADLTAAVSVRVTKMAWLGAAGGGDPVGGGLLGGGEAAVGEDVGLDALGDDRRVVERAGGHLGLNVP